MRARVLRGCHDYDITTAFAADCIQKQGKATCVGTKDQQASTPLLPLPFPLSRQMRLRALMLTVLGRATTQEPSRAALPP
jgi:hypothetical protein